MTTMRCAQPPAPDGRLPPCADSHHIGQVPKPPKKPKLSTGKATKPELKPLDEHLAALLNPALNREREAEAGFAERAQEVYVHGEATDVDPGLAKKLGLRGPDDGPDVAEELGDLAADASAEASPCDDHLAAGGCNGQMVTRGG